MRSSPAEPDLSHAVISTRLCGHIKDYLSRNALTATTMLTLDELASRLTQTPALYHDLYPCSVGWYRAILQNSNISGQAHKATVIHLFKISAANGDHAAALDTAVTARLRDPADTDYALMEADARIALHQLKRAEDILLSMKREPNRISADTLHDIDILLAKIQANRARHEKP